MDAFTHENTMSHVNASFQRLPSRWQQAEPAQMWRNWWERNLEAKRIDCRLVGVAGIG